MEGRFQKTARNVLFATINQFVSLALSIINRTLFIWVLGVEYLGISGLFADILTMLSLADLGLGTAMVYSYYKPLNNHEEEKIAQLTQFYKKIYMLIAIVVSVIGISLLPFLKYLVNLEKPIQNLNIYYLLMVGNTVASYLFVYKTSIINADQKNYIISKYQTITNCLRMLFQIVVLLVTKNYALYLLVQVLSTILNNVLMSKKADILYPYINNKVQKLENREKKSIFVNIKSMALYKVSLVVFSGIDNTLISVLVGTIWVGIYSNYNLIISTINSFINILYSSATASIGNVIAAENEERRYEVFQLIQVFSLVITTISTCCLYTLAPDLINLWLGNDFILDRATFVTILLNFYFNGLVHPIWSFREACGLYNRTKYVMLVAAIVNFVFSVVLGMRFGIAGILIASLIARITTYFWYEPKILFTEYFSRSEKNYYFPLAKNIALTLGICVFIHFTSNQITVVNWIEFILKTIFTFVCTTFITFAFYWQDNEFKNMLHQYIIKLFKRG